MTPRSTNFVFLIGYWCPSMKLREITGEPGWIVDGVTRFVAYAGICPSSAKWSYRFAVALCNLTRGDTFSNYLSGTQSFHALTLCQDDHAF